MFFQLTLSFPVNGPDAVISRTLTLLVAASVDVSVSPSSLLLTSLNLTEDKKNNLPEQ